MAKLPGGIEVKKIIDRTEELLKTVNELTTSDVLVGIPKKNNGRKDSPIGNASLAHIHEFGSPAQNIPARPFLYPGVKRIRRQALAMMRDGAVQAVKSMHVNVDSILTKVGLLARNSVVLAITDPDPPFVPLKPATIRARLRRTKAGQRKLKQLKQRGIPLTVYAAQTDPDGTLNIRPLLDTTQMRAAITYVVRKTGEVE